MKLALSSVVLLWFTIELSQAQMMKPIELLSHYRKRMGLEYNQPSDFQEVERADTVFWPGKGSTFLNAIAYKIKPGNADIIIALSFYNLNKTGLVGPVVKMKYDDNNQLIGIRYLIGLPPTPEERAGKFDMNLDTSKVKFFNDEELKKYGATYGGIAEIPMDKAYWQEYWKLRILFFFKKGKGQVYQYYFYNEGDPIDKTVNDSRYILKFKE
jgi:hypothetical protein